MFNFFLFALSALMIVGIGEKNESNNNSNNYPSGYELKRQLRKTIIYDYDITSLNYDLIEEYIFRDYVHNFEKVSGYSRDVAIRNSRDVAIRKALDKYIKTYGILKV